VSNLDYRTWGATRNCKGCRFWSEMLAQCNGGGPIEALCISPDSPNRSKYMTGARTCASWQSGELGAVDSPGGDPYSQTQEAA